MNSLVKTLLIVLVILLAACKSKPAVPEAPSAPPKKEVPPPVTEIVQSINLTYGRTWETIKDILAGHNLELTKSSKASGEMETVWAHTTDRLCGVYNSEEAPLSCQVKLFVKVERLTEIASSVTVRYVEQCLERKEFKLECPGSNAEKLLFSVIAQLKARAGVKN